MSTRRIVVRTWMLLGGVCVGLLLAAAPAPGMTDAEFLRLLERAEQRYGDVKDYTAVMLSTERLGDDLIPEKRVLLKFQRPFSVYMRWVEGPGKGRQGLYIAGANGGRFVVAEPEGIARFFTARVDPTDSRVMEQSRHPVTNIGIGRLLEIVGENARRGIRERVLRWKDHGPVQVAGRVTRQVEGLMPQDPAAGYYGYRVSLFFDEEHGLPIRVVTHDWKDRLVEDYAYTKLVINPGLTARDFDLENPDYGLSRWRIRLP
jgi:hypothetical protein